MKRFAITVSCFCIYFVGLLNATPLTEEDYKYVYQYSLTPPDDDYFPMILEEFVRLESPFKTTSGEPNGTNATETEQSEASSTTPSNVSTTPINVLTTPIKASTTPANVSTTPANTSTTPANPSTTPANTSTTPPNVSKAATGVPCVNETTTSKISGTEVSISQAPATVSPTVDATTKKVKTTPKGNGPDSSMYIVGKGDIPEIVGLNIGLYYVLRDTKKKMERDEEISVKPLIRILALTEKIKKLGGRVHPRNQDLMKKIYGETLKTLSNSS